jgi:hypothetical protein
MIVCSSAYAAGPGMKGEPYLSRPHPRLSGTTYTLNVLGKKDGFTCPKNQPDYGNVIFIPKNGGNVEVMMQSGAGSDAATITDLQVVDPCAGLDGSQALFLLPPDVQGYTVVARALAQPKNAPDLTIVPQLVGVEDASGNDLAALGLVTATGFEGPSVTISRKVGKGHVNTQGMDISNLFYWTGEVCYLDTAFCDSTCTATSYCCSSSGCSPAQGNPCPAGTDPTTTYCKTYDNEWVFNIGDVVTYKWDIDNNGLGLMQLIFSSNISQ